MRLAFRFRQEANAAANRRCRPSISTPSSPPPGNPMAKELVALLAGQEIGRVRQDTHGHLHFRYERNWREADNAYPLSLSMPLATEEHGPKAITPFLWGLLPDNELVLERWARKYQVSARNPFALLSRVGEDCAGAVQFVAADRVDAVNSGADD